MPNEEKSIQQRQAEVIAKQLSNPRITKVDQGLIRNTFASRHDLIIAMRNVFFGQATKDEKKMVKETFKSPELRKLMRKVFLPEIAPDDPLKQSIDLWQTVRIEIEEAPLSSVDIERIVEARRELISCLDTALNLLENPEGKMVNLAIDEKKNIDYVFLKSRNSFISHVETQLVIIITMAATIEETEEEALKRMRRDSSK